MVSFEATRKSAEAFRTISEVAAELDLPQHVLRFWETRFQHLHPLMRAGGRRYYRPEDIDLLRGIAKLLYAEGLTIKGVQKILREQGPRYVGELGRGETDFMTPLKRVVVVLAPDVTAPMAARVSNVHPFPTRADDARTFTSDQCTRLQELLSELLAMKSRLASAKADCGTVSRPL
jgi:DNA-binding transcriptional MerR regulator